MSKACFKCGVEKPLSSFYKHSEMGDGHLNKCKECTKMDVKIHREENLERIQEYDRNRPNHTKRIKMNAERLLNLKETDPEKYHKQISEAKKEWGMRNPNKRKAQCKVSNAVRDGRLEKKTSCENCGSEYRVQAHHESYEEDRWLDVVWLCDKCHKERHKIINEFRRNNLDVSPLIIPF